MVDVSAAMCALAVQLAQTALPNGGFLSPLSIYAALLLTLNAAGVPSSTHSELLQLLARSSTAQAAATGTGAAPADAAATEEHINSAFAGLFAALSAANSAGAQLLVANSLWTKGVVLKPQYVEAMQKLMQATVQQATSADDINAWVANATHGLIQQLIAPGTKFDVVLANAVYFKGKWQHAFDKAQTQQAPFYTSPGAAPVQVNMMAQTFKRTPHDAADRPVLTRTVAGQYEAVRLPYQGDAFSAIALLPHSSSSSSSSSGSSSSAAGLLVSGTLDLQDLLQPASWQPLGIRDPDLRLLLPRLKAGSKLSLSQALQGVGVRAAFSQEADFGRLADGRLFVSDVLHSAVVEVDEEGTKAAAATAVMVNQLLARPPRQLVFDRPFLFMVVHDNSSTPLFVGTVTDPTQAPQL